MERKFFAGGNTGEGFYDFFDFIQPEWDRESKTYILKGGPGVGKNTMMREVASASLEQGLKTELFYCAGDPESLDAVYIPEKKFIILDGTAPHVREPEIPGVTHSILNLGIYLQESGLAEKRNELETLFAQNQKYYVQAYLYLRTASAIQEKEQKCRVVLKHRENIRRLFLTAITHQGIVDFTEPFLKDKEIITVKKAEQGVFFEDVIRQFAGERMEVFFDALLPECVRVVYIVDLGLLFVMESEESSKEVAELIAKSVESLKHCKAVHDEIEEIYKANMNFDGVSKETRQLIKII